MMLILEYQFQYKLLVFFFHLLQLSWLKKNFILEIVHLHFFFLNSFLILLCLTIP